MKIGIESRWSGEVLFETEAESLKIGLELAVKARAYLDGAYLAGANLAGANLAGAYLAGANLDGANLARANLDGAKVEGENVLTGERPIFQIGPLGSRCASLVAYLCQGGIFVRAGCFFGTVGAFAEKVKQTHLGRSTQHAEEYGAAIAMIEAHARLWTPKETP